MILVCGATGTIGSRVVNELVKADAPVRTMVREVSKISGASAGNIEQVPGDLAKPETLARALQGIDTVFLLTPVGPKQLEMEQNLVSAAVSSGVRRLVKLSAMGASSDANFDFARIHGESENSIRASGLGWTFVRPNMFMQNLGWYQGEIAQGRLPLPLGSAAVSHVDAGDVAAVSARALLNEEHALKSYTVSGPEALTGDEVSSILSEVLRRSITYRPPPTAQFREFLKGAGESEFVVNAECELFEYWSQGAGQAVTSDVEQVLGRKPVDLKTFVSRNASELFGG